TDSEEWYLAQGLYKAGRPWNLAFLAMANHQLGDKKKAQVLFNRVRELSTDPLHKDRLDVQSYFREAQELIEAKDAVADLYAARQDWERAIAEYHKLVADPPANGFLATKLALAYQGAGRTREGVAYLAKAFAANPRGNLRPARDVAALQAWFG